MQKVIYNITSFQNMLISHLKIKSKQSQIALVYHNRINAVKIVNKSRINILTISQSLQNKKIYLI